MDVHDQASLVEVRVCSVCPAWIATNEGGATPEKKTCLMFILALKTYDSTLTFKVYMVNLP